MSLCRLTRKASMQTSIHPKIHDQISWLHSCCQEHCTLVLRSDCRHAGSKTCQATTTDHCLMQGQQCPHFPVTSWSLYAKNFLQHVYDHACLLAHMPLRKQKSCDCFERFVPFLGCLCPPWQTQTDKSPRQANTRRQNKKKPDNPKLRGGRRLELDTTLGCRGTVRSSQWSYSC